VSGQSADAGAGAAEDERLVRLVHDLRTPLTVISGFADLLQRHREKLTESQRDEYVLRIAAAAEELRRILDDERERRTPAS
jgi:signal transduction histidine kinase